MQGTALQANFCHILMRPFSRHGKTEVKNLGSIDFL